MPHITTQSTAIKVRLCFPLPAILRNIKQLYTVAILSSHFLLSVLQSCVAGQLACQGESKLVCHLVENKYFPTTSTHYGVCILSEWGIISCCDIISLFNMLHVKTIHYQLLLLTWAKLLPAVSHAFLVVAATGCFHFSDFCCFFFTLLNNFFQS